MGKVLSPVALCLLTSFALAACAPAAPAPQTADPGGGTATSAAPQRTLVMAVRGEPPSIASLPVVGFSGSLDNPRELFNANLDFRDEREQPRAVLAEALPQLNTDTWRVFPDGRMETTYKLKPNLTWHDGTPLSAEDFVFAWRVYATPELGVANTPPIGVMEAVEAPDPRTVVIRWRQPYPEAVSLDHDFQALPRHILEAQFRDLDSIAFAGLPFWTSEYVGLGPYRVTAWEPGTFIEGAAFDGYALGRPKIDQIRLRFISDPQTALANILSGEVHLVADPIMGVSEGQTLEQQWAQNQEGIVLYSPVGLRTSVVQLRPEHQEAPALLDVRVRRAVRLGVDAEAAVQTLTAGKAILTRSVTSPGIDFYAEIERGLTKYAYDPRRAQQLMEEAGFKKGPDGFFLGQDGQPIRFSIASSAGERQETEVAVYVDGLKRAGFDVSQRVVPVQQIQDPQMRALLPGIQVRGGADELVSYTSEQIPGPTNRWYGDNRGGWSNAEYDRLHAAYTSTLERSERIGQIARMEQLLNEDAAVIPHMFNAYVVPHVAALRGPVARHTPLSGETFLHVHTWEWKS
jgi:peptide/nickel transport system substrate-binding protein